MRFCGISEYYHDASIAFIDESGNIEFAAESERYSKRKNDPHLHKYLVDMIQPDDHVTFYESTVLRRSRAASMAMELHPMPTKKYKEHGHITHHESHAASAFYTRPWDSVEDTVMMTIDGFGEWQSATIMDHEFQLKDEMIYPMSVGSIYALVTYALNLKPLEEEYIVMGMAAYGDPIHYDELTEWINKLREAHPEHAYDSTRVHFINALKDRANEWNPVDIAASIQLWAENNILDWARKARAYGSKLVYAGGVAQNVVVNSKLLEIFDEVHIAINPGDGGGSIGAAAWAWSQHTGKTKLNWVDPYLGYNETSNDVNPKEVAEWLNKKLYCGVINGQAEFGPRALGNRSLLGNPLHDVKDTVNKVKNRQKFRPFAPAIMEEFADEYFEGPMNRYMQFTAKAKHNYKSVTHVDGSARVQLVPADSRSVLRPILEEFYELTGVPMLLNTSLNVRGRPICNDKYDAKLFEINAECKVFGS